MQLSVSAGVATPDITDILITNDTLAETKISNPKEYFLECRHGYFHGLKNITCSIGSNQVDDPKNEVYRKRVCEHTGTHLLKLKGLLGLLNDPKQEALLENVVSDMKYVWRNRQDPTLATWRHIEKILSTYSDLYNMVRYG